MRIVDAESAGYVCEPDRFRRLDSPSVAEKWLSERATFSHHESATGCAEERLMATKTPATGGIQPVAFDEFEERDVWQEDDERARIRGYFPLSPGTPGAGDVAGEGLMVVSMEIEPGNYLPTHRDSAEELLFVTTGTVEATVGEETARLSAGEAVVVPADVPHGLRNVGDETARVVGFFPENELTATFAAPLLPFETNVVSVGGTTDE